MVVTIVKRLKKGLNRRLTCGFETVEMCRITDVYLQFSGKTNTVSIGRLEYY
jgi:hypothetical protein